MPTVPISDRSTTITLASASAGPFDLDFRLFDDDKLEVYVNHLPRTDFTIQSSYVDGYDDNATITFNSSLSIADVIIVDSALVPSRDQDYVDGPGLTAKINIELSRMWSAISDLTRNSSRSLKLFSTSSPSSIEVGRTIIVTADGIEAGPNASDVASAQLYAEQAAISAAAAASSFDSFDDKYLGAFSTDPTVDNDGDALQEGALYVNTGTEFMNVYISSTWVEITLSASQFATAAQGVLADGAVNRTTPVLEGPLLSSGHSIISSIGTTVASAGTIALPSDGDTVSLSGAATITAITNSTVGRRVHVVSTGTFTFTNSATLVVEGGANWTAAVGDVFDILQLTSTISRVERISKADGTALVEPSGSYFGSGVDFGPYTHTLNSPQVIPHGMTPPPKAILIRYVCLTAQHGFAVGDELREMGYLGDSTGSNHGLQAISNDTDILLGMGNQNIRRMNPTTGGGSVTLTPANWEIRLVAL